MGRLIFSIMIAIVCCISGAMFLYAWITMHNRATMPAMQESVTPPPVRKCVNMGGALEAPTEGSWGYTIRERDFVMLKRSGFDTVRIPIKWSAHTEKSAPYRIDTKFLVRVNAVINQATDAGLKVIVNVHHYDELNEHAEDELPRFYAIWEQLIAFYGSKPNTVMFEFLNEPHTAITPKRVDEINRKLLARVRTENPERWVILGGGDWGTLDGLLKTDPPFDRHAMVTFHYYSPFEFTHQGAPWAHKKIKLGQTWGSSADRKAMAKDISRAAHWRDKVKMPLLLGEFGVYTAVPDMERANWTNAVRRSSETAGFGWCYWDFATSLGMYDLKTETFRPGMLSALIDQ